MKRELRVKCSITALATIGISFSAFAGDVDVDSWKGDFGELVQRMEGRGTNRNWKKFEGRDYLREADLFGELGYSHEALLRCEYILEWHKDSQKEPSETTLRSRITKLQRDVDRINQQTPVFNSVLAQLNKPTKTCHITESDLPDKYLQAGEEKRLDGSPFISNKSVSALIESCPILEYSGIYNYWTSQDDVTQAVLVYDFLGPFVVISKDSGATWTTPLYLGLHRLPDYTYLVMKNPKLPLIDGSNILIEVTVWNRDRSKRGGPLLGYKYHWKKWNRMLTIPIASVSSDKDGDGLTDLFEERILTNPLSKDTDKDGIGDAIDSQPLLPKAEKLSVEDEIALGLLSDRSNLIADLFNFDSRRKNFIDFDSDTNPPSLTDEGIKYYTQSAEQPIPPFHTTFVASERDALAHITGNHRFIVLNDTARNEYIKNFGFESSPGYANFDMIVSPDKSQAYLDILYHQRGESFAMEKKQTKWSLQKLGSSIRD